MTFARAWNARLQQASQRVLRLFWCRNGKSSILLRQSCEHTSQVCEERQCPAASPGILSHPGESLTRGVWGLWDTEWCFCVKAVSRFAVVEVFTSPDFFGNQGFGAVSPRITNLIDECWCLQMPPAFSQWQSPNDWNLLDVFLVLFFFLKEMMHFSWIFQVF